MFRASAARVLARNPPKAQLKRPSYTTAQPLSTRPQAGRTPLTSGPGCKPLSSKRPCWRSVPRPAVLSLFYATKSNNPPYEVDAKAEDAIAQKRLKPHPEQVSTESSVRPMFSEQGGRDAAHDEDMLKGIKQDMKTIAGTFALQEVPKESYYLGAAGILPYAATSMSTVYLAYDFNHAAQHGTGYLFSPETAAQLLNLITPIQIGYGAVIISFLGAIHWGLEYAGYGGHHSYRRYMYGVIAPAVAWPTIFMPVETALISQFLAFVFLYFADARATVKGWFPPWYSSYRFVLTFFVGASIVLSLIGRGQIAKHDLSELKSPIEAIKKDKDQQWEALEKEEMEKQKRIAEEEEAVEETAEKDDRGEKSEDDNDEDSEDVGGNDKKSEDS